MTDPLASISRLRAFVEDPTNAEAAAWARERLRKYLENAEHGLAIDDALGIRTTRGRSPWWKLEQQQKRAAAARTLLAAFGSPDAAIDGLRRYAQGRGRHAAAEAQYTDPRLQAAHDFVTLAERVPTSSRTLMRTADTK